MMNHFKPEIMIFRAMMSLLVIFIFSVFKTKLAAIAIVHEYQGAVINYITHLWQFLDTLPLHNPYLAYLHTLFDQM